MSEPIKCSQCGNYWTLKDGVKLGEGYKGCPTCFKDTE